MSILLIPVAPLEQSKSRLRNCFTREQLSELTIALMKDLGNILKNLTLFEEIIVYCKSSEILQIAEEFGFVGIREKNPDKKNFNILLETLNNIAINEFHAKKTVISFLDLALISETNFREFAQLLKNNQLVITPSICSAGISMIGRNPPNILKTNVFNKEQPSLISLIEKTRQKGIEKVAIYDSFRAGFDIDIKIDLLLGYEYLKILNLTKRNTYKFLKNNLSLELKCMGSNNRNLKMIKE